MNLVHRKFYQIIMPSSIKKIDYDNIEKIQRKISEFLYSPYRSTQFTIYRSKRSIFSDENMKFVFDYNFDIILNNRLGRPGACTYIMEVLRDLSGNKKKFIIVWLAKPQ